MEITIPNLKTLFWKGLIPGPQETLPAFLHRVQDVSSQPTIVLENMQIDWVPIIYDNKRLRLWEGGCSWIGQDNVQIQLREAFKTKNTLYYLYSKQELLQHEAIHAIRLKFQEPRFEEMLAYYKSPSKLRAKLGPIFRSPKESLLCMMLVAVLPFFPLAVLPVLMTCIWGAWYRLSKCRRILDTTYNKLSGLTDQSPFCWLCALTDAEIDLFSKLSSQDIVAYAHCQKGLRWEQLRATFLTT